MQLLLWIHEHASAFWDGVFRTSHVVGGPYASAALALAVASWHLVRHERREAVAWLTLGLSTLAIMEVLKVVIARPRPELWPRIVSESGFSFPSGHALASASFYPVAAWEAVRRRAASAPVLYGLAILGSSWVGIGRLYLGVHWPSDVLAGWMLGVLQSTFCMVALARREGGSSGEPRGM